MKTTLYILVIFVLIGYSCKQKSAEIKTKANATVAIDSFTIFTEPSKRANTSLNFNSPFAINKIAAIENEYFNAYPTNKSKYYGTQWYLAAIQKFEESDSLSVFEKYVQENNQAKLDSMHCTIYAIQALKAGFGSEFDTIEKHHSAIWGKREFAGWSIGHILTKFYNWKGYLFISKDSNEYEACLKNFKKDKNYHVWKQPNIPIEALYDVDENKKEIDSLLKVHEFGWGFSDQGWHTWITRFDYLKECNWLGAPAERYNIMNSKPLFLKTRFRDFRDYDSHIIVFPPTKN